MLTKTKPAAKAAGDVSEPTNDGAEVIEFEKPYRVEFELTGVSDLLFHRWSVEAVNEKAKAAKNSAAKKTDNVESYVYRDDEDYICMPGEYVRQSVVHAAKFRQDPRSPRKSAMDLYKAGVISLTNLASMGVKEWDYEDTRRVVVQRNGINRTRPAMKSGWTASFQFLVTTPQYIDHKQLLQVLNQAGMLVGLADFRPTFGRFAVTRFELLGD